MRSRKDSKAYVVLTFSIFYSTFKMSSPNVSTTQAHVVFSKLANKYTKIHAFLALLAKFSSCIMHNFQTNTQSRQSYRVIIYVSSNTTKKNDCPQDTWQ